MPWRRAYLLMSKKGGSLKALQQLSSLDVGCLGDPPWIVGYILSIFIETEAMPLFNMMNPDPIQTREFLLPVPLHINNKRRHPLLLQRLFKNKYPQDLLWDELEKQTRKKQKGGGGARSHDLETVSRHRADPGGVLPQGQNEKRETNS